MFHVLEFVFEGTVTISEYLAVADKQLLIKRLKCWVDRHYGLLSSSERKKGGPYEGTSLVD